MQVFNYVAVVQLVGPPLRPQRLLDLLLHQREDRLSLLVPAHRLPSALIDQIGNTAKLRLHPYLYTAPLLLVPSLLNRYLLTQLIHRAGIRIHPLPAPFKAFLAVRCADVQLLEDGLLEYVEGNVEFLVLFGLFYEVLVGRLLVSLLALTQRGIIC
jgi:hypothetical protein